MTRDHIARRLTPKALRVVRFLASDRCFYIILALFVGQALWFAFAARYPMAFDEDFHFGLIRLHAQQWLPFFTSQPAHADQFGAVARDPSYLYHYLMSLPYRIIALITQNTIAQVIVLRCINIALAGVSFVLARRMLLRLGGSRALTNAALLLTALIPIAPFLAAHINYDNLFVLLVLWSFLATFDWVDKLRLHTLTLSRTMLVLSLFALASLVKYAYLPIAVILVATMAWEAWRQRANWPALRNSLMSGTRWRLLAAATVLLLSTGLWSERYIVNTIQYHEPNPDCAQVLSVQRCLQYSPWARDYYYALSKPADVHPDKLAYVWQWLYGMWMRTFFAISDTYDTQPPLPLPGGIVVVVGSIGLIIFAWFSRRILHGNIYRQVVVMALGLYVLALVLQTFQTYLRTNQPVAINGRYLIPFLPMLILLIGLAYRQLWRRKTITKVAALLVVFVLFLEGGGMLTFILRSKDSWYWPNDAIVQINRGVRDTLQPFIIGGRL